MWDTDAYAPCMRTGIGGHQSPSMIADRWLTPKEILEPLGHFDLDPCGAPGHLTADTIITPENGDGLSAEWFGRVWLNPPYGRQASDWLERLRAHGHGTALIFARTETRMFFDYVWGSATALLFLDGRLTFLRPDGSPAPHNSGAPSVLVAYGASDAEAIRTSGIAGAFVTGHTVLRGAAE